MLILVQLCEGYTMAIDLASLELILGFVRVKIAFLWSTAGPEGGKISIIDISIQKQPINPFHNVDSSQTKLRLHHGTGFVQSRVDLCFVCFKKRIFVVNSRSGTWKN